MKSRHGISLLLLSALLAACGSEPAPSVGPNDHAAEADHEEGEHTEGEGGDGEEAGHEEGPAQTRIPAEVAADAGIRVGRAGPGVIADEHEVQGLLTPVDGAVAKVMARFPGPIRALRANVGDRVRAGQPLATIESNLSLTNYTVSAPISGVVLSRDASVGAVASEGMALYEIVNTSELWVDLHIFGRDAQHIQPGNAVAVTRMSDGTTVHTTLERILPSTATASQSTVARARIPNADGLWRPGTAVKARVTVDQADVALVVPLSAIQTDGDDEVVYVKQGTDTYVTRPVSLGRRDARRVEVLEGLKPGERIVVWQSFLIKADIEKSTAEHEH